MTFVENDGVTADLESFSANFDEHDLILLQPDWQWQQWSYALHFIYGLDILPNTRGFDRDEFNNLLTDYENIYIISDNEPYSYPYFPDASLELVNEASLEYP